MNTAKRFEPRTIADLVQEWSRRGERPAVLAVTPAGDLETLGYAALARDVQRLAAGLARDGLGDGAPVLLWAPNSPQWIVAYFAAVLAGGIVVPLDDQSTQEQLDAVLRDSRPERAFTTAAHRRDLEAAGLEDVPAFLLEAGDDDPACWRRAAADGDAAELPALEPERVAALLYTSGTTGTPKGVPLTHDNLMCNVRALLAANIVRTDDRLLLPLPLHHAYPATVGMLFVLACGATVVLPAGLSGPELTDAARKARATILIGVPRLYTVLVDSIEAGVRAAGFAGRTLFPLLLGVARALHRAFGLRAGRWLFRRVHRRMGPCLRILASGGARLEPEIAAKLETLGWLVLTGYGLTETSPIVSFNTPRRCRLDSQGLPLEGVEIRIDSKPGEAQGEIQVRGPNVFSGYWRQEDATRRAFADGWFRTNDLGFVDADGFLHVLGRQSEVIVLADGKKISPEGLERVYEESEYIHEVALLERKGVLAAIVVAEEDAFRARGTMSEQAVLRDELERLAQSLPGYQRVADFRIVREPLPRTRLGKLRRHLLDDIFSRAGTAAAQKAAARPDEPLLEYAPVRAVWRWLEERYADRGISLDSSPQLDLGIDSLAWMSLTTELEERFGIRLRTDDLSRVLTVRDLLEAVKRAGEAAPEERAVPRGLEGERYVGAQPAGVKLLGAALILLNKLLLRVLFRLRVEGLEHLPPRGPMVLTPNHASYLDSPAVGAALPLALARRTCWAGWVGIMHRSPLRRLFSRAVRVYPVDPDRDIGAGIRLGAQALERGLALVWFPEGRRSPSGELQNLRRGIGVLLEQAKAPAVPVRLRGTFEALPVGRRWPRFRPITVRFGRPVAVETLLAEGHGEDAATRIADALERHLKDL